ncbi:hypothetical protein ABBQ32_012739 [Trebouxia sp. C0010 RCD-2024]
MWTPSHLLCSWLNLLRQVGLVDRLPGSQDPDNSKFQPSLGILPLLGGCELPVVLKVVTLGGIFWIATLHLNTLCGGHAPTRSVVGGGREVASGTAGQVPTLLPLVLWLRV